MTKTMMLLLTLLSTNALAQWHHLEEVTRVTVRGDTFYIRGSNPTGKQCTDESNFYGTLNHVATEDGHNEYYSMALMAYASGQGMSCYISSERSNGVCVMMNCYIK